MSVILASLALLGILIVLRVLTRPGMLLEPGGRALAFVGFFALPLLITAGGASEHLEHAKTTDFCLSCHEMEPYGRSLLIASGDHLPATHYQNGRIPRDQACYTCHTSYALFGDVDAKLKGLQHLWVHFAGGPSGEPLLLYEPFENRECLYCHEGARSFVENPVHEPMLTELRAGNLSCLDCHAPVHDVSNVESQPLWKPPVGGESR